MRIIIDLQGAQSASRFRGIGRYSLALAQAVTKNYNDTHEIIIVLNYMLPETIESIYQSFNSILHKSNIKVWRGCSPVHSSDANNDKRIETSSLLRESFLASLKPDIVLIMSTIEGYNDNSTISLTTHYNIPTAVVFYDAIPFMQPEKYINPLGKRFEDFYHKKLEIIKNADLIFGISESSCREAIEVLQINQQKITNISSAADSQFYPREYSHNEKSELFKKLSITKSFLLYSGATDERKNHLGLIEAFSLLPENIKSNYQLVLAGGIPLENHIKFKNKMTECKLSVDDVIFTGRISDDEFVALYNLCHLYVFPSYHEGFGLPALEAMQCGAATIGANTTSIPEVIGREDALFDPHNVQDIANKIESVLIDETFRIDLQKHSLLHAKNFSWKASAIKLMNAIEEWKQGIPHTTHNNFDSQYYINHLVNNIAKINNTKHDLLKISQSIAYNHPKNDKKQLLIDISELVKADAKSGIQRVVRSILNELLSSPQEQYTIKAIYATQETYGYKYANKFMHKFLNKKEDITIQDHPIDIAPDDIFLGLDMAPHIQSAQKEYLQNLKNLGIHIYFIVYDLLSIHHPQWWPNGAKENFEKLLETIISTSDGIVCISKSVADDVKKYITHYQGTTNQPHVNHFHLGADIANSVPSKGLDNNSNKILKSIKNTPSFLMVGTIEPRKGHMQTLAAFELLWAKNIDVNLVIVGKPAWLVDNLVNSLQKHQQLNKKLFWLESISDEYLEKVYAHSACLLAVSEGEGFGLPLIEAAQKKLPIIARDLPVFKEVAGKYAYYFPNTNDPSQLNQSITQWLQLFKNDMHPKSDAMPWLTWEESTEQLKKSMGL